jgi:hypothetical protein
MTPDPVTPSLSFRIQFGDKDFKQACGKWGKACVR